MSGRRPTPALGRLAAASIAAAAGTGFLAACGGGATDAGGGAPATRVEVPSGDLARLVDPVGARADLVRFRCRRVQGAWAASGTVVNRSGEEATYLVEVTLHKAEEGTVVGSSRAMLTLAAGERQ